MIINLRIENKNYLFELIKSQRVPTDISNHSRQILIIVVNQLFIFKHFTLTLIQT